MKGAQSAAAASILRVASSICSKGLSWTSTRLLAPPPPPWSRRLAPARSRCAPQYFYKNRRYAGKSQSNRPAQIIAAAAAPPPAARPASRGRLHPRRWRPSAAATSAGRPPIGTEPSIRSREGAARSVCQLRGAWCQLRRGDHLAHPAVAPRAPFRHRRRRGSPSARAASLHEGPACRHRVGTLRGLSHCASAGWIENAVAPCLQAASAVAEFCLLVR
jgi:hypothetical protein